MINQERRARKVLKFGFRVKNTLTKHRISIESFGRMENLLWNTLGRPMVELRLSTKPGQYMYWRFNPTAKWARFRNEFLFIDQETMDLIKRYKSAEFIITNKII